MSIYIHSIAILKTIKATLDPMKVTTNELSLTIFLRLAIPLLKLTCGIISDESPASNKNCLQIIQGLLLKINESHFLEKMSIFCG